nr:MAG: hypothetical protein DIU81_08865 [[Clostridium] cellulosi]
MTYTVTATQIGDWLWQVDVSVCDDHGAEVLTGSTTVACETEEQAREYGEKVFLPDLRRNYPREIGALVFPWEEAPEQPEEAGAQ